MFSLWKILAKFCQKSPVYANQNLPNFCGKEIFGKLLAHFDTISIFGAFLC